MGHEMCNICEHCCYAVPEDAFWYRVLGFGYRFYHWECVQWLIWNR